jgi:hypothetical protein
LSTFGGRYSLMWLSDIALFPISGMTILYRRSASLAIKNCAFSYH